MRWIFRPLAGVVWSPEDRGAMISGVSGVVSLCARHVKNEPIATFGARDRGARGSDWRALRTCSAAQRPEPWLIRGFRDSTGEPSQGGRAAVWKSSTRYMEAHPCAAAAWPLVKVARALRGWSWGPHKICLASGPPLAPLARPPTRGALARLLLRGWNWGPRNFLRVGRRRLRGERSEASGGVGQQQGQRCRWLWAALGCCCVG